MRLIDADALASYVRQHWEELYPKDGAMIDAILVAPTVDAVEVVRCKDCKCWDSNEETCYEVGGLWRASDFCSWGERKRV